MGIIDSLRKGNLKKASEEYRNVVWHIFAIFLCIVFFILGLALFSFAIGAYHDYQYYSDFSFLGCSIMFIALGIFMIAFSPIVYQELNNCEEKSDARM